MPLPVLPGVVRVSVGGKIQGGGNWANTWHIHNDSGTDFDDASITALHANFIQFYTGPALGAGNYIMDSVPTGTTLDTAVYTPLDGSSGGFLISVGMLGVSSAAAMPAEVAEVVTLRTADRGRQNRGRIYLPAFVIDGFDGNGLIKPAAINAILAQLVQVETAIIAGGAHIGVGSYGPYRHGGTPHFTPCTTFTMDNRADVQRGRKT